MAKTDFADFVRFVKWIGVIQTVLMFTCTLLFVIYLIESQQMSKMMDLSVSMNESTTRTMTRIHDLLDGVQESDVTALTANAVSVSGEIDTILKPISEHNNISTFVEESTRILAAIDTVSVKNAVKDAAAMVHQLRLGIDTLNSSKTATHMTEIIDVLDSGTLQGILADIQNATATARALIDALAVSHKLSLTF